MRKTVILSFLVVFLTSCSAFTAKQTLTLPPTTTSLPAFTSTLEPTLTLMAISESSSLTLAPFSTLTPQPTITTTPASAIAKAATQIPAPLSTPITADSSVPLNRSGPWLAYRASREGFEDQVGEAVVVNPDGSGRRKLADNVWSLMASPASPYLAVLSQP
jgi:hypothetical protein